MSNTLSHKECLLKYNLLKKSHLLGFPFGEINLEGRKRKLLIYPSLIMNRFRSHRRTLGGVSSKWKKEIWSYIQYSVNSHDNTVDNTTQWAQTLRIKQLQLPNSGQVSHQVSYCLGTSGLCFIGIKVVITLFSNMYSTTESLSYELFRILTLPSHWQTPQRPDSTV